MAICTLIQYNQLIRKLQRKLASRTLTPSDWIELRETKPLTKNEEEQLEITKEAERNRTQFVRAACYSNLAHTFPEKNPLLAFDAQIIEALRKNHNSPAGTLSKIALGLPYRLESLPTTPTQAQIAAGTKFWGITAIELLVIQGKLHKRKQIDGFKLLGKHEIAEAARSLNLVELAIGTGHTEDIFVQECLPHYTSTNLRRLHTLSGLPTTEATTPCEANILKLISGKGDWAQANETETSNAISIMLANNRHGAIPSYPRLADDLLSILKSQGASILQFIEPSHLAHRYQDFLELWTIPEKQTAYHEEDPFIDAWFQELAQARLANAAQLCRPKKR